MELKSFREFMWNKRRNEYLRLKYTKRYQDDPEPWETMYKDVTDTLVTGLTETRINLTSDCPTTSGCCRGHCKKIGAQSDFKLDARQSQKS